MANGSAHETGGGVCIADRLEVGPEPLRIRIRTLALEAISMLTVMTHQLRARPPRR